MKILGESKYASRVRTLRTQLNVVDADLQMVELPATIMKNNKDIKLSTNVLQVNITVFLGKVLWRIIEDVTVLNVPQTSIAQTNYIAKKQNWSEDLIFGDQSNVDDVDNDISSTRMGL